MLIGCSATAYAHGDQVELQSIIVAPRAEARLGVEEIVITYTDNKLFVFLQKFVDGEPTTGASVEATIDFIAETLEEIAPGIYGSGDWPLSPGQNDVELSFAVGDRREAIIVPLVLPSNDAANAPVPKRSTLPVGPLSNIVLAVLLVGIYLGVMRVFVKRHSVS